MERQLDLTWDPNNLGVVFDYGTHDDNEKWEVLNWGVLNNDYVEFTAQNIETGERTTQLAGRQGWEWGIGELLDLTVYGL